MTFPHVNATEPEHPPRKLRNFTYRVYDGSNWREIEAHEIYFYDHCRIGFWNYNEDDDGERVLVLATKAFDVREVVSK
ncbi:hypothetical protein ACFVWT_04405 [Arthrobacter sp. NPDC058288]|uniref:hypothetical protein n=1 Tax=Arthrobacter sp. NPDC058288 TaxID=3346424 RepID=UPI0036E1ED4F